MLSLYARAWRIAPRSVPSAQIRGKKKKTGKRNSAPTDLSPDLASLIDLSRIEAAMQKAVEALRKNYAGIHSNGASPGMLDGVKVEAYGASTALQNVAQVSVRDGRTLVVSVFDEGISTAVQRSIRTAGLNLNPIPEGPAKLKVPIPKQTEKAREELAKTAIRDAEAAKVATRLVRRKAMDTVKSLKGEIGKEDQMRMENFVEQMSNKYVSAISQSLEEKVNSIHVP